MALRNKRWGPFAIDQLLKGAQASNDQAKKSKNSKPPTKSSTVFKADNFNFFHILQPEFVEELAVHPKKISEVSSWLDNFVLQPTDTASLLLITGPSGCGKLMTVKLLCKERSIGLTEWINPIKLPQFSEDSYDPSYMNQTSKFIEFVVESSYCSLVVASRKRICIIKDFPHKLLRNSEEFESALENICMHSNVSVIFIVTDDSHVSTNIEKNLFGDAVKAKFNIGTISFNACAASLLKGAMKRALKVIQTNLDVFQMVSDDVIEAICNASYGDIRCCMNQLYVAALKGSVSAPTIAIKPEPSVKLGAKRKRRTNALTLQNRPKDEVLGLFHCVGRVLNPKFDPVTNRIKQDIEIIMDEFSTQPSVFLNFLHENYIKHFGDVGDAAEAAEALSLAQTYMENWVGRHETITTGVYVAVITLMLNNKHKINAFTPIRGPKKFAALPAKTQVEGMQFASSTDMCYYNSLVKGEKFPRFSFLPQEKE